MHSSKTSCTFLCSKLVLPPQPLGDKQRKGSTGCWELSSPSNAPVISENISAARGPEHPEPNPNPWCHCPMLPVHPPSSCPAPGMQSRIHPKCSLQGEMPFRKAVAVALLSEHFGWPVSSFLPHRLGHSRARCLSPTSCL